MSPVYCHPSLCLLAADTLTLTGPNPHTDTESQWYYSWNACYVFSTNERMKKNKQRGQIKREKKIERRKRAEAEKEMEGERGIQSSFIRFVFLCMFYMMSVSASSFLRADEFSD